MEDRRREIGALSAVYFSNRSCFLLFIAPTAATATITPNQHKHTKNRQTTTTTTTSTSSSSSSSTISTSTSTIYPFIHVVVDDLVDLDSVLCAWDFLLGTLKLLHLAIFPSFSLLAHRPPVPADLFATSQLHDFTVSWTLKGCHLFRSYRTLKNVSFLSHRALVCVAPCICVFMGIRPLLRATAPSDGRRKPINHNLLSSRMSSTLLSAPN